MQLFVTHRFSPAKPFAVKFQPLKKSEEPTCLQILSHSLTLIFIRWMSWGSCLWHGNRCAEGEPSVITWLVSRNFRTPSVLCVRWVYIISLHSMQSSPHEILERHYGFRRRHRRRRRRLRSSMSLYRIVMRTCNIHNYTSPAFSFVRCSLCIVWLLNVRLWKKKCTALQLNVCQYTYVFYRIAHNQ